jgi:hypothetical protein
LPDNSTEVSSNRNGGSSRGSVDCLLLFDDDPPISIKRAVGTRRSSIIRKT